MKREYVKPDILQKKIALPLLEGVSTETLSFDQNDNTEEALSKDGSSWDDDALGFPNDFFDE